MEGKHIPGRRRVLFSLALLVLVLPALTLTASAGHPVGTPFPIRAEAEVEVNPAIAYNSQNGEYLVVLWNDRPGNDDIRAERLSRDGRKLSGVWVSAGSGYDRRYPDVAYNSKTNQYLVVWQHYLQAVGAYAIYGRLITAAGQLVGTSDIIIRAVSVTTPGRPAVAYSYTSNKYLVVWEEEFTSAPNTWVNIEGQALNSDGTLSGGRFDISVDPGNLPRRDPDLAYNRHANGFLVVWQQLSGGTWNILGQLVNGDGSIPGFPPIPVAMYTTNCTAPAVAAIPTTPVAYKYLVVWEDEYAPNDRDIYGKVVEENGTPYLTATAISTTGDDESEPAVAGDEAGERYLVAWSQRKGVVDVPIHVQAVNRVGNLVYDKGEFGGPTAHYPAVAAGSAGTFLVAWQDKGVFATNTDILGQFWGNRVYLPLVVRNK
jgi:hypothetical protein